MKNTIENKIKFFSLYMDNEKIIGGVFDDKNHLMDSKINFYSDLVSLGKLEESFLVLKDLQKILPEDTFRIGIYLGHYEDEVPQHHGELFIKRLLGERFGNSENNLYKISDTMFLADDLRLFSRYALPFNGLSLEKMLEYGWFVYE